tara:strand:+ start:1581 stop:1970 length:390 start_codon:yes stop_codon:yes gene_type:complete
MFEVEAEYRVWVKVPLKMKVAEVELGDAGLFKVLTESNVDGAGEPTTATNCYKNVWDATLSYELSNDLDQIAYDKKLGEYIDYERIADEFGEVTDFTLNDFYTCQHLPDTELLSVKTTNFSLEDYSRNS